MGVFFDIFTEMAVLLLVAGMGGAMGDGRGLRFDVSRTSDSYGCEDAPISAEGVDE